MNQTKTERILAAYDEQVRAAEFVSGSSLARKVGKVTASMVYAVLNEHRPEWRLIVARKRMEKRV